MDSNLLLASENGISEALGKALENVEVDIFGFKVGAGVISSFIVTVTVIILTLIIRFVFLREYKAVPKGVQLVLEKTVGFFENIAKGAAHSSKYVAPLIFGVAIFIFFGTLIEMFGLRPVFSDLNAGLAVGLVGFCIIQILGLKEKGLGGRLNAQFRSMKGPLGPIVGFFKTLSDLILPFSMSLRLYGSILSGMLIMEIIYVFLEGLWLPLAAVLPGFFSLMFTVFHAVIQSYVFALLVSLFTGEAVE
ncbi:MAG: F0F1 ATP synthase subunit A [Clostridiales bacterium]|jgi:F-type H+-transporting ATPase subunit a|nr:F0F1 ATP synthase subunit A [Clostridiales bacterium]